MRRKKRLKLILWLVIISLGMGMLLLFVPGQNVGIQGFDNSVATVAGDPISAKDFSSTYSRFVQNYSDNGRNKTDVETLKRLQVDKQALNALIQVRVVNYVGKQMGLNVTPEEVTRSIESNPSFRSQAGFIGVDAYKSVLATNGIDVDQFEQGMKYTLLARKVLNLLTDSLSVPEKQIRDFFRKQNSEAQVQYVLFDKEAAKKKISPAEAELKAYFEANKDKYFIKEKRKAQYLLLSVADIAAQINVTEQEIDAAWAKEEHSETVTASHILLKVDDPAKDAEVKAKAEALLKRAKANEDFAELARQNSQDEGSAAQGGNLGPFTRGKMTKVFEDAAFSLKAGEISNLVRSEFGYHIIKVQSHEIPSKETSRLGLIRSIQIDRALEICKQKADEALKMAATQKDFAAIAKALNVPAKVQESPLVDRGGDAYSLGLSQEFVDELFALKEKNSIGKPVDVAAGRALPKLIDIVLPKPPGFQESADQVRKDYMEIKSTEAIMQQAQKISDDAKTFADLAKAAQKAGVAVKTSDVFKQNAQPSKELGIVPEFNNATFELPVGGVSGPVAMNGGKQIAVLQVKTLTPINEAEYAKQKSILIDQALSNARNAYFDEYIRKATEQLEKARKIRINASLMDQITSAGGYRY
jgi:peptidyl-prolyl cis-trans isomerase D